MYGDSEESLQYKASAIPQYKKTKIRIKTKTLFLYFVKFFLYKVMFLSFNNHSPPPKKKVTLVTE